MGLHYRDGTGIAQIDNKQGVLDDWIDRGNYDHNYARISRVLASMTLFGLTNESDALMKYLKDNFDRKADNKALKKSMGIWENSYKKGRIVKGLNVEGVLDTTRTVLRSSDTRRSISSTMVLKLSFSATQGVLPLEIGTGRLTAKELRRLFAWIEQNAPNQISKILIGGAAVEGTTEDFLRDLDPFFEFGDKDILNMEIQMKPRFSTLNNLSASLKSA